MVRRIDLLKWVSAKTILMPAVKGGAAQIYDVPGWREASDHQPVEVTWELPEKIDLLPALKGRDSLKQPACKAGGSVEGRFPLHRSLKLLHGQWRQVLPTLYSERRSHRHGRSERT